MDRRSGKANQPAQIDIFLNDFVFRDCRLGQHPKVRAHVRWLDRGQLVIGGSAPRAFLPQSESIPLDNSLAGHACSTNKATIASDIEGGSGFSGFRWIEEHSLKSMIAVPLGGAPGPVGVLSMYSTESHFFSEADIGRAQLLGALLAYLHFRPLRTNSPITKGLGEALKRVRQELRLTQDELAVRLGQSRAALSQWELGSWPTSPRPLYQWCKSLGLASPEKMTLISFVDLTPRLLNVLRDDPDQLRRLSPAEFERLVAERLDWMGYDVTLTGATTQRDGGIDLIAVPKIRTLGSFLLAGQVKHHRGDQKVTRGDVDRLLAWKNSSFRLGLLVTNTAFTKDARWIAEQSGNREFLRLRDFEDLKRWIENNFTAEQDWREIPDFVELAPGIVVEIPRSRLDTSRDIWPLSGISRRRTWQGEPPD